MLLGPPPAAVPSSCPRFPPLFGFLFLNDHAAAHTVRFLTRLLQFGSKRIRPAPRCVAMSHARDRSMRLRRLCLEDTISTFSVAKDFMSGDDRFIQRVMFSDIH